MIRKEHWFSVPYVGGINKFIEALTGEYKYDLSIHFACGAGCYLFLDTDSKIIPITEFVDAAGTARAPAEGRERDGGQVQASRERLIAVKALARHKQVHRQEEAAEVVNFTKLLMSRVPQARLRVDGKFQMKTLFLGMMHFQDEYTYDIQERGEVRHTLRYA